MHPANEWRCYIVKSSLTGWAHTQNDPCNIGIADKDGPACWAATNTPYGEYWTGLALDIFKMGSWDPSTFGKWGPV